eukprot:UN03461
MYQQSAYYWSTHPAVMTINKDRNIIKNNNSNNKKDDKFSVIESLYINGNIDGYYGIYVNGSINNTKGNNINNSPYSSIPSSTLLPFPLVLYNDDLNNTVYHYLNKDDNYYLL